MRNYREARQKAAEMKAFGATQAELEDRARRFDAAGQYFAAAAFRDVASQ